MWHCFEAAKTAMHGHCNGVTSKSLPHFLMLLYRTIGQTNVLIDGSGFRRISANQKWMSHNKCYPGWLAGRSFQIPIVTYSPDWVPVVSGQFYLPSIFHLSLHALFSFKPPPPPN